MSRKKGQGKPHHHKARRSGGMNSGGMNSGGASAPTLPLVAALSEAEKLVKQQRWVEARTVLEPLAARYPNNEIVLHGLAHVYGHMHDGALYEHTLKRLLDLVPDDADVTLALAEAYLTNMRLLLAVRTLRAFLARWPAHARAAEARKLLTGVEPRIAENLAEEGLVEAQALEAVALHEEALGLTERGEYARARQIEERALRHQPGFIPSLNTISMAYALEGRLDQAIATARRVLERDPQNFHGLGNLTRYLCLSGRVTEAASLAPRLKAVHSDSPDAWVKKAEALSFLGDDAGVLEAMGEAERAGYLEAPFGNPLGLHLAAVAAWRLGREEEARRLWRRTLKLQAGFDLAQDNLADLRKPIGERHAPWPYSLGYWVNQKTITDLRAALPALEQSDADQPTAGALDSWLRSHPEILALVPLLLDHGDPAGREFALRTAATVRTPELLAALRDFALGQRGPDQLRMEAARIASEAGLISPELARLWLGGEWQEILLLSFEISDEPVTHHAPDVENWLREATLALHTNDAAAAEPLLRRALEAEPDAPDILNNLAVAYEQQGRKDEAAALLQQIHQRFPDYFFAQVSLAIQAIRDHQIEQARAMMEPLLKRRKFHHSEFRMLAIAQMELYLAENKMDGVRSWYEMLETIDPDDPALDKWGLLVAMHGLTTRLRRPRRTRKH